MAIGESVPMLDSRARVMGTVEYMVNLKLPNMLVGKIVRATVPHARLVNVDASSAEKIAGVVAVLTRADISKLYGMGIADQGVVAIDRVRFIGEPVAVIAAEDRTRQRTRRVASKSCTKNCRLSTANSMR